MEYEFVPGKHINCEYVFVFNEEFLYVPVNKVNGKQRYKCIEEGCRGGVSINLSDNIMTRFRHAHSTHGSHRERMDKLAAIRTIKEKCRDVNELFSNQQISTKAVFDKQLVR